MSAFNPEAARAKGWPTVDHGAASTQRARKAPFTIRAGMVRIEGPWVWQCSLCWAHGATQLRSAADLRANAHVMNVHPPCPKCDRRVDVNGDCPKGCADERDLPPLPPIRTARDRFGSRVR